MTDDKYRVRIKIGAAEFEAEGERATVEEQARQFLELVKSGAVSGSNKVADKPPVKLILDNGDQVDNAASVPAELERVFKDRNGVLTLAALPRTKTKAADTLLALLYGYQEIRHEPDVLGGHLLRSGQVTGLSGLDRVDRVLSAYRDLYTKAGSRKGARYALTNPGIEKAKEIIAKLFE